MGVRIAPSILAADFARLAEEIARVEAAGADLIHLDVMDAHFVPNLTFGPMVVEAVSRMTDLERDTHLMISDPDRYLDRFIDAGATTLSFHLEAFADDERQRRTDGILHRLEEVGVGRGIAVNPDTPIEILAPWLDRLDHVLIMTVHPGFGGQVLIPECLEKIPMLRDMTAAIDHSVTVGVDGGVNDDTAADVIAAGTDILVAGSAVFRSPDPAAAVSRLRRAGSTE